MKLLLDTHILLLAAGEPERLSPIARALLEDPEHVLTFSVASLWEIVIKRSLGRDDFRADPHMLRRGLLDNGYQELPVAGPHALHLDTLPPLHKDPFDRLLLSQAAIEGMTLVTADRRLGGYPGPVRVV